MVLESRTRTGDLGEDCAVHRLESMGYRILTRNWRGKRGEVDVIARDDDHVVAVEVKTRSGCGTDLDPRHWMPSLAQQRRIVQSLHAFLARYPQHLASCRFDVMLVRTEGFTAQVEQHLEGAFDGSILVAQTARGRSNRWTRVR